MPSRCGNFIAIGSIAWHDEHSMLHNLALCTEKDQPGNPAAMGQKVDIENQQLREKLDSKASRRISISISNICLSTEQREGGNVYMGNKWFILCRCFPWTLYMHNLHVDQVIHLWSIHYHQLSKPIAPKRASMVHIIPSFTVITCNFVGSPAFITSMNKALINLLKWLARTSLYFLINGASLEELWPLHKIHFPRRISALQVTIVVEILNALACCSKLMMAIHYCSCCSWV